MEEHHLTVRNHVNQFKASRWHQATWEHKDQSNKNMRITNAFCQFAITFFKVELWSQGLANISRDKKHFCHTFAIYLNIVCMYMKTPTDRRCLWSSDLRKQRYPSEAHRPNPPKSGLIAGGGRPKKSVPQRFVEANSSCIGLLDPDRSIFPCVKITSFEGHP